MVLALYVSVFSSIKWITAGSFVITSCWHVFTCSFVPGIFGNQQASYVNLIQQLFHHCLLDQESEKVRLELKSNRHATKEMPQTCLSTQCRSVLQCQ